MEFLVIALDGKDADAPNRRMASREAHLAAFKELTDQDHVVSGGALRDDDGAMIGSALILDLPGRTSIENCSAEDPYTWGDVRRGATIRPYRLVR